jgi:predicted amidophosphoribosyltransferase
MSNLKFNASYKICNKCKKELSRTGEDVCKECKPKRLYNRTLDKGLSKKYLHKFETKTFSRNISYIEDDTTIGNKFLYSSNSF